MDAAHHHRIALIGHDADTAGSILDTLQGGGYSCRCFTSGATAIREIDSDGFDCILFERSLPDIAPVDLLTAMRARVGYSLPLIGLAADQDDIVTTLDDGADECLSSPISPRLLLAQIRAAIRRIPPRGERLEAAIGHLTFQAEGCKVNVDEVVVPLTAKEYALALLLCRRAGEILQRDEILLTVWGDTIAPTTRTLDVHISRLRSKLDLRPARGFRLLALYGRGYRLDYNPANRSDVSRA